MQTLELSLDNGIHMRALVAGDGPRDVIFLHGFPELAHSWRHQLGAVPPGFRFIAPDMRGYGGTSAPRAVRDYSIDKLVGDVTALARALKLQRVDLVGHDWGGAIAWEVARQAPQLLRTLAVLNCPPGDVMLRQLARWRQLRMSWYMFAFQLPWLPERMIARDPKGLVIKSFRQAAVQKKLFTAETLAPYIQQVQELGLPGINYYRAALLSVFRQTKAPMIHTPTRLIWGLGDTALGPWFADKALYAEVADRFDVVQVPDSGHWVQQEAPSVVNAALAEFWQTYTD